MKTAMRCSLCLLCCLFMAPSRVRASETTASAPSLEGSLLHRRLDLSGLRQWQRKQKTWKALPAPSAKLLVVNLWSRTCKPCLKELPLFNSLVEQWRGRPEVQFLFIADPPTDTSPAEAAELWSRPLIMLEPEATCLGTPVQVGGGAGCILKLPEADPVRLDDGRAALVGKPELRPLTLLVDRRGTIRHCIAGMLGERKPELEDAIRRLLQVLSRETP